MGCIDDRSCHGFRGFHSVQFQVEIDPVKEWNSAKHSIDTGEGCLVPSIENLIRDVELPVLDSKTVFVAAALRLVSRVNETRPPLLEDRADRGRSVATPKLGAGKVTVSIRRGIIDGDQASCSCGRAIASSFVGFELGQPDEAIRAALRVDGCAREERLARRFDVALNDRDTCAIPEAQCARDMLGHRQNAVHIANAEVVGSPHEPSDVVLRKLGRVSLESTRCLGQPWRIGHRRFERFQQCGL